jgi:hypothetical protein
MVVRELHSFVVGRVEQMTKVVFQVLSLEVLIDNHLVVLQDILLLSLLQLLVVVILDLIAMWELVPLKLMFQLVLPMNKSVLVMVELVLVKVVQLLVAMTLPMAVVIVLNNQVLLLDQVDLLLKRHVLQTNLVRELLSVVNKGREETNVLKLMVTQHGGLIDFLLKGNVMLFVLEILMIVLTKETGQVDVLLILYHLDNLVLELTELRLNVLVMVMVILAREVLLLVVIMLAMEAVVVKHNQVVLIDQEDLWMKQHVLELLLMQVFVKEHLLNVTMSVIVVRKLLVI